MDPEDTVKRFLLALAFALVAAPNVASAQSGESIDKYMEMMRTDIRSAKVEILTDELKLSDAQAPTFWALQREYESQLGTLSDQRLTLIKDYAKAYGTMDDKIAKTLMDRAFKLQEQRTALLKKYSGKVAKDVSPQVAARFAQVESFVQSLLDVKIRGEVPIVP